MRGRAKTINFATIYGQGPFALSRQLGITQDEAKAFIAQYFERFAGVRAWLDRQVRAGRESRATWKRCSAGAATSPRSRTATSTSAPSASGMAQNSPLQGSAADLIKIAMIRLHARAPGASGFGARLLLQVHDELVLEAPVEEVSGVIELVKNHMEGAAELSVPLVVDVGEGDNWVEAKS